MRDSRSTFLVFLIMSARSFVAFLAVLAVLGLLGFGLLKKSSASLDLGQPAPDGALPRLSGAGSGTISDYRGRWVLVNFWASWCEPCKTEAPALESFQNQHAADGFTVLGVNL